MQNYPRFSHNYKNVRNKKEPEFDNFLVMFVVSFRTVANSIQRSHYKCRCRLYAPRYSGTHKFCPCRLLLHIPRALRLHKVIYVAADSTD